MIVYTNYINEQNNCCITIDLETCTFDCRYTLNNKNKKITYPLGTTKTDAIKQIEIIFKGVQNA